MGFGRTTKYRLGACFLPGKRITCEDIDLIKDQIIALEIKTREDLIAKEAAKPLAPDIHDREKYYAHMSKMQIWVEERDALRTKLDIITIDKARADQVQRMGANFSRVACAT